MHTPPGIIQLVHVTRTTRGHFHRNEDRACCARWCSFPVGLCQRLPPRSLTNPFFLRVAHPRGDTVGLREVRGGPMRVDCRPQAPWADVVMWTVCDGHDGATAADFVVQNIAKVFEKSWIDRAGTANPPPRRGGCRSRSEDNTGAAAAAKSETSLLRPPRPFHSGRPLYCRPPRRKGRLTTLLPPSQTTATTDPTRRASTRPSSSITVDSDATVPWQQWKIHINAVFTETCKQLENMYAERCLRNKGDGALQSGSCVNAVFLLQGSLYCVNLGDSRAAVLSIATAPGAEMAPLLTSPEGPSQSLPDQAESSAGTPSASSGVEKRPVHRARGVPTALRFLWLNTEHRASDPGEAARILERGGSVDNGRIKGVLEPSRTIGDLDVKLTCAEGVVATDPEIRSCHVVAPCLLLLATDGIWDFMTPAAVSAAVEKHPSLRERVGTWLRKEEPQPPQSVELALFGDLLIRSARRQASHDDCTVTVVWLCPRDEGMQVFFTRNK
eukprot:Polyplicarium_translucidae@DN2502_c0_g1_i2.p1